MSKNLAAANKASNIVKDVERVGVAEVRKLVAKFRASAISSWRRKKDIDFKERLIKKVHPLLKDAMLAAHLRAIETTEEIAAKKGGLKLSIFDDMLKKYKKLIKKTDFKELEEEYDTQAFNILAEEGEKINTQLRSTIFGLIADGAHVKEGIETLNKKFESLKLSPQEPARVETIFRTQTQVAYSAGRWEADQHPAIQDILWGYEYVTVGDDRVRDEHEVLDGTKLRKEDPFWDVWYPPNGWNCRCQVIQIFKDEEEAVEKQPPTDTEMVQDKDFKFNPGHLFGSKQKQSV